MKRPNGGGVYYNPRAPSKKKGRHQSDGPSDPGGLSREVMLDYELAGVESSLTMTTMATMTAAAARIAITKPPP